MCTTRDVFSINFVFRKTASEKKNEKKEERNNKIMTTKPRARVRGSEVERVGRERENIISRE